MHDSGDKCVNCATLLVPIYPEQAEKGMRAPFGSIAGKKYMAPKILPGIPPHRVYCEPFAGGAALFWAKKKEDSTLEVLGDIDPDIVNGYAFLRDMSDEDVAWLQKQRWDVSLRNFKAAKALQPTNTREQFWKFKVEQSSSWSGNRKSFGYKKQGPWAGLSRLATFKARLAGVKAHHWPWDQTIKKYDSPDTFFFIDPPYNDRIKEHGDALFPRSYIIPTIQLRRVLRTMKGKFVLTVSDIPENRAVFNCFKQIRIPTEQHQGPLSVGSTVRKRTELVVSNFDFRPSGGRTVAQGKDATGQGMGVDGPRQGTAGTDRCYCPSCGTVVEHDRGTPCNEQVCPHCGEQMTGVAAQKDDLGVEFVVKDEDLHIVGGIVYKAREPDSQGDWSEAEQVQEAMYAFMESGRQFSTDHESPTTCNILECFQAEETTKKEGKEVPAGSWWLTVRILDDNTWDRVRKGELTGYSWEGLILRDEGVSPS